MPCPHFEKCSLADAIQSKVALLLWQRAYCEDERRYRECARFELGERGMPIPPGLLPNGARRGAAPA